MSRKGRDQGKQRAAFSDAIGILEEERDGHLANAAALGVAIEQLQLRAGGVAGPIGAPTRARRRRLQPGSIEDRIVEILGEHPEPIALDVIVKESGAPKGAVIRYTNALIADGRITRVGRSRSTRYTRAKE